jgi:hypothetical protein
MSEWMQYKPKLALYDILDTPGGVSVDDAMKRAEGAVENYRGQAMAEMSRLIRALEQAAQTRGDADAKGVYQLSLDVLNIAGLYHPSICRVANSLCDLAQRMAACGRWDWPSVGVHVSAMRLLTERTDQTDPATQAVLRGLASVVAKFPDPSPVDPPRRAQA